jgi:hypothetical protein
MAVDRPIERSDNSVMARDVLSLMLVVQVLLGPHLCCCTFGHFQSTSGQNEKAAAKTNELKKRSCCCSTGSETCPFPGEGDDSAPRRSCPCRDTHQKNIAVLPPATELARGVTHPIADGVVDFCQAPFEPANAIDDGMGFARHPRLSPFLTTRDLLRAHHMLRC